MIDLAGIKATAATLGSTDVLTITNGSKTVAKLQLTGTYTGATFSVASDHQGGTDITDNVPGDWPSAQPAAAASPAVSPYSVAGFVQAAASLGSPFSSATRDLATQFPEIQGPSLLSSGAHRLLTG